MPRIKVRNSSAFKPPTVEVDNYIAVVAVDGLSELEPDFWIGFVNKITKNSIECQWYEVDENGFYDVHSDDGTCFLSDVLHSGFHLTTSFKLYKKDEVIIKNNLTKYRDHYSNV